MAKDDSREGTFDGFLRDCIDKALAANTLAQISLIPSINEHGKVCFYAHLQDLDSDTFDGMALHDFVLNTRIIEIEDKANG